MSKRTPPAIKNLIVELSKKGKYVSEIIKCTNKPWSTCKKTLQKYWETGSTENTWNNIRQVKCTLYSQRLYKANEDNKNGFFGIHKGEICRFFE